MGGHDFQDYCARSDEIPGPEAAYRLLVDEATAEYGHDGYNGTISTTNGCFAIDSKPMSRPAAEAYAERVLGREDERLPRVEKWGPAAYIPIGEVPTRTRTVTKTLSLDHETQIGAYNVRELLGLGENDVVTTCEILSDERAYKTRVIRNRGKAARRFKVMGPYEQRGYATLDEAIGAVKLRQETMVARASSNQGVSWGGALAEATILEEVTRDGEGPAKVVTTLERRKVKVSCEVQVATGEPGKVIGWLFFGIAAS